MERKEGAGRQKRRRGNKDRGKARRGKETKKEKGEEKSKDGGEEIRGRPKRRKNRAEEGGLGNRETIKEERIQGNEWKKEGRKRGEKKKYIVDVVETRSRSSVE